MMIGSVAFLAPWLLAGLATLPILWWLLRAVPPAPGRRAFPGVRLLLGLTDDRLHDQRPLAVALVREGEDVLVDRAVGRIEVVQSELLDLGKQVPSVE